MASPKILVVGSINMDLCLRVPRVPLAGESLVCNDNYYNIHGGKGANQAVAAARLGADVTFTGKVGDDSSGKELAASLVNEGICTDHLSTDADSRSGLAIIILEETGENRIIVYPESNMKLTPADVEKAFEHEYDAIITQFEVSEDVVIYACKKAKEKGIPVIVDAGPAQDFPIEEIKGVHILTPNETETLAMCDIVVNDIGSAGKASKILMERSNAQYIVIKAGSDGAYVYDGEKTVQIESHKVTPIDTTAAGDAFTAAMTIEYLRNKDIKKAVQYGNAAGAATVMKLGAQPSLPMIKDVEDILLTRL